MADKWTIRSNNEGLYKKVKPPEEGDTRKKKKEQEGRVTVASGKTQHKTKTFYLRTYP